MVLRFRAPSAPGPGLGISRPGAHRSPRPLRLDGVRLRRQTTRAAFTALAFAVDFSFPGRKYGAKKILSLLAYGVTIELVQHFLPYRDSELWDIVADGVGLLLYGLSLPLLRRLPGLRQRWSP
jgi:hypothetical protein